LLLTVTKSSISTWVGLVVGREKKKIIGSHFVQRGREKKRGGRRRV